MCWPGRDQRRTSPDATGPEPVMSIHVALSCSDSRAIGARVGSLSICPLLFTRDLSGSVGLTGCAPSACRRGLACFLLLIHTTSDRSGGKVGIPPLLRDCHGAVGAVGNRGCVCHGLHAPAHPTPLRHLSSASP